MTHEPQPSLDDPRLEPLAAALGLDRFSVYGRLAALVQWARRGPADPPTLASVDAAAECVGFAEALERVGLLVATVDGISFQDVDGRQARRREGVRRRVRRCRERKRQPGGVTERFAPANETDEMSTPTTASADSPPAEPLIILPPDPTRQPVRSAADAPHLLIPAQMVLDFYLEAVGLSAPATPAAVVAVMDLLDRGVPQAALLRPSLRHAEDVRLGRCEPMGPAEFFAADGNWRGR